VQIGKEDFVLGERPIREIENYYEKLDIFENTDQNRFRFIDISEKFLTFLLVFIPNKKSKQK